MPYSKKKYSYRKKRPYPSYKVMRNIAQSVVNKNVETKRYTHEYNATAVAVGASSPIDADLYSMGQGDTPNSRTGNRIIATGVHGSLNVVTADTTNIVRLILYIPRDTDDNLSTDALEVYQQIDPDKYTILFDKTVTVGTYNPLRS